MSPSRTVHTGPAAWSRGRCVAGDGSGVLRCGFLEVGGGGTATAVRPRDGSGGSGGAVAVPVTPSRALPASTALINDDAAACGTRRPGIRSCPGPAGDPARDVDQDAQGEDGPGDEPGQDQGAHEYSSGVPGGQRVPHLGQPGDLVGSRPRPRTHSRYGAPTTRASRVSSAAPRLSRLMTTGQPSRV